MITYRCSHCYTEIGAIPFASIEKTVRELQKQDDIVQKKRFVHTTTQGELEVHCICETCEHTLQTFPDYYTVEKWLQ